MWYCKGNYIEETTSHSVIRGLLLTLKNQMNDELLFVCVCRWIMQLHAFKADKCALVNTNLQLKKDFAM